MTDVINCVDVVPRRLLTLRRFTNSTPHVPQLTFYEFVLNFASSAMLLSWFCNET